MKKINTAIIKKDSAYIDDKQSSQTVQGAEDNKTQENLQKSYEVYEAEKRATCVDDNVAQHQQAIVIETLHETCEVSQKSQNIESMHDEEILMPQINLPGDPGSHVTVQLSATHSLG